MAEALTARGITVTQLEQLTEVLPTIDAGLGRIVADELRTHGVDVHTATRVIAIDAANGSITVRGVSANNQNRDWTAELVMVVTGVTPDSRLAAAAGAATTGRGAIKVDRFMRTNLPDVYAAGDCATTHHILLGESYLPLGTTAHKQGRIAGENAVGGQRQFAGSAGTQAVKVFDLVAARTGIRDHEAADTGYLPATVASTADDHTAYYPGARTIHLRTTGDTITGRLLGVQMVGDIPTAVHKRIDTAATAIYAQLGVDQLNDLDLSYTPPLGSPWDALQAASQQWMARQVDPPVPD
jgi:NADPH-dependent 2,4-dienoyl-CoA reductase/sulfur reductase-like enzyme